MYGAVRALLTLAAAVQLAAAKTGNHPPEVGAPPGYVNLYGLWELMACEPEMGGSPAMHGHLGCPVHGNTVGCGRCVMAEWGGGVIVCGVRQLGVPLARPRAKV